MYKKTRVLNLFLFVFGIKSKRIGLYHGKIENRKVEQRHDNGLMFVNIAYIFLKAQATKLDLIEYTVILIALSL